MYTDIELSVVLPCLNEEAAIANCLNKIHDVFKKEGIIGEIIIIDNGSTDRSREIAELSGAKVISEPSRGYGSAYLAGLKEARGNYIIIADIDNSYDFYEIPQFLSILRQGGDFVIGSRFKGKMQKNAMHWSHRYIGNPVISSIFRVFFHTNISDALCGMRGFSREAYKKMNLRTLGMEFATEMIVSALQNGLKISEVAISYYPRQGKSKLRPFSDGWRYLRFMLLYCPLWLYYIPGLLGFAFGFFVLSLLMQGPFLFLGHHWDIHMLVFASLITIVSYQILNLGVFARTFAIGEGFLKYDRLTHFFQRNFSLEKGLILGAIFFISGAAINIIIFIEWFSKHFGPLYRIREAIFAMTLLVIGLQTIFSSFFIGLLLLKRK